jgi:hypothetical protein
MNKVAIIALLATLVGCTTVAVKTTDPRQIWCSHNAPHNYSSATLDTFSRAQIDDENNYQDTGIKWCGWKSQSGAELK